MWTSPDCHGIVAVLVVSGKQPASGLLHTLWILCVCVGHLSASCKLSHHLLYATDHSRVLGYTIAGVTTSTHVEGTASMP